MVKLFFNLSADRQEKLAPGGVRVSGGDLCKAEAPTEAAAETILPYFKGVECNMTVRVSGGDLCEAEAPTEAAAETKDASKMSAQFVERDLFSGSLRSH